MWKTAMWKKPEVDISTIRSTRSKFQFEIFSRRKKNHYHSPGWCARVMVNVDRPLVLHVYEARKNWKRPSICYLPTAWYLCNRSLCGIKVMVYTCVSSVLSNFQPSSRLVSFTVITVLSLYILKGFSFAGVDSGNRSLSFNSTR